MAKKTKKNKQEKKYAVMFGFQKSNIDNTAFLKVCNTAHNKYGFYDVVKKSKDATYFPIENYDNLEDFATPVKWAKFFNNETDLNDWKFHSIQILKK